MSEQKIRSINKKKKFVADGVFQAELHEFLGKMLNAYGYAGLSIRAAQEKTTIKARVVGDKDKGGVPSLLKAELESLIRKRYGYEKDQLQIVFATIQQKSLCAAAQCENIKAKLLESVSVRFAAQSVITNVIKGGGAHGCEVVISGKLRQQRAKAQKYKEGYLVSTGHPRKVFVDEAIRHVFLKQGMIGVKVKIMLPYAGEVRRGGPRDARGETGDQLPTKPLPDKVIFKETNDKDKDDEDFLPGQRKGAAAAEPTPQ